MYKLLHAEYKDLVYEQELYENMEFLQERAEELLYDHPQSIVIIDEYETIFTMYMDGEQFILKKLN